MAAVIGPVTYGQITSLSGGNYRSALLSTLMFCGRIGDNLIGK
jgi:hypothetical protein